jgi:hypothetical protein
MVSFFKELTVMKKIILIFIVAFSTYAMAISQKTQCKIYAINMRELAKIRQDVKSVNDKDRIYMLFSHIRLIDYTYYYDLIDRYYNEWPYFEDEKCKRTFIQYIRKSSYKKCMSGEVTPR